MPRNDDRPEKESAPHRISAELWIIGAFAVATLTYLWFFYTHGQQRQALLTFLLLPDDVVASWYGWDLSRFGMFDRWGVIVVAGLMLLISYLPGRLALDWLRLDTILTKLERNLFALGVGLNVVSLYTLIVGLLGGLQSVLAFLIPALVSTFIFAYQTRPQRKPQHGTPPVDDALKVKSPVRICFWLGLPFAIAILAGGMLPPWQFDVREYHAQVPKEWYQQGYIGFVPHNVYGNMPLGAEMHAIIATNILDVSVDRVTVEFDGEGNPVTKYEPAWWSGVLVGKTIIAAYAPLTALLLYAFGRRFLTAHAGAIAALVFISTPWIAHVSMSGLIDGVSAFYLLATLYGWLLWRQTPDAKSPAGRGLLLLTGFLAGASVACKYPGLVFVVIPIGLAIILWPLGRVNLHAATIYSCAVVAACGLWFGKNAVVSGNPTYPLLYSLFDGRTRTPDKDLQWTTAHGVPTNGQGHHFSGTQLLDSVRLLTLRSDYLSPLLVPLGVMGLFVTRYRRLIIPLALMVLVNVAAWWLLTHRLDRFLIPTLPLVALLCGLGATWSEHPLWRWPVGGLVLWSLLFNWLYFTVPLLGVSDNRFLVSYEELRRDVPSTAELDEQRIHPTHKWLNAHVGGYRVMLVGEAQAFDLEMPLLYNTCFDDCVFEQMMKGRSREERLAALREAGVSYIFVFWHELDRYREPGNYGYSDYVTRDLIRREFVEEQQLLREVTPLLDDPNNSQLFEVVGWKQWEAE